MIARLQSNRVRRTYLGGGRINAFTGTVADCGDGVPRPEDWLASTVMAFNGTDEKAGEGLGRLGDGRLVRDVVGDLPFLVKLLDSDERLVIQAHPTVPCAKRHLNLSPPACVVVTEGVGEVNGVAVKKGDRLLIADERFLETNGPVKIVICVHDIMYT